MHDPDRLRHDTTGEAAAGERDRQQTEANDKSETATGPPDQRRTEPLDLPDGWVTA